MGDNIVENILKNEIKRPVTVNCLVFNKIWRVLCEYE